MYILVALFILDDSATVYSKDDFRIAMVHSLAEKYVQMGVEAICFHVFLVEWWLIMISLVSGRFDHAV